ncbi:dynamin-related protein [Cryptosporidium ubiquitum]|uniref:Dynamin-related protein n=1 Tax=Cryptosporidium ubiquitum TaxID=857276 RepID=A0A1J4MD61_9CRYT|nr:dynamin-related protein [Cryptosporidium ubiquitum]OII71919.1 dynamin-related protein [Cryptosporidium ubiquitum]
MESLIPVINELHDILTIIKEGSGSYKISNELGLDLPEIAVVGSQSVGKSSLLEYIIGRHFLPRGQGIVTRRPLILQLQQIRQENRDDYAEFGHKKGLKFTDFEKVKEEILIETNRLIGENKNVSEVPILLRIFSKKAINLTLVDLPGLTKVPVEDQPSDIESQIRKIVLSYIRRPSCLILAITAANTDIANSDSLNIAREVDPEGLRTIGVLSKLDTVENYSTTIQVLSNQSYPLNRGYVAVMCRDSRQKAGGPRSLRASLNEEKSFFENNSKLKSFQSRCGTYNLVNILQKEFLDHILKLLPQIKNHSKKLIDLKQMELLNYGDFSQSDILDEMEGISALTNRALFIGGESLSFDGNYMIKNKGAVILNCFSKFSRKFQDMIDGQASYQTGLMKLSGGARLNYVFHNWFGNTLFSFDPLDGLSDTEIRTAIKNSTGTKSSLFVSEGAFEVLARIQIKKLLRPSLTCVEQVYEELKRLVEQCSLPELNRYSNLKNNMISVVNNVLEECLGPTNRAVVDLINMELAYINTNHPDFIGGASALTSIFEKEKACLTEGLTRNNSNDMSNNPASNPILLETDSNTITPSNRNRIVLNDFFNDQHEPRKSYLISAEYNETENVATYHNYKLNETYYTSSASRSLKNIGGNSPVLPTNHSATSSIDIFSPARQIQGQITAKHAHAGLLGANLVENEKNYLGKYSGKMGLPIVPETIATTGDPSEREKIESDVIKFFIVSYFNIVRKNIADSVPKAVMYFMVNAAKEAIQRELVAKLYKEEIFDDLLQEEKGIVEKRQQCHRNISKLSNITKQLETLISNLNL